LVERLHGMQEVREFDSPRLHQKVQVKGYGEPSRRTEWASGGQVGVKPQSQMRLPQRSLAAGVRSAKMSSAPAITAKFTDILD
jgi:hypothetical protein